jgi:DNA-binding transcriptional regulator YdaS (Cro superfamily)
MEKLRAYLNSLSLDDQKAFSLRCGASIGYLRKAISINQQLSEGLCLRLAMESGFSLQPEDLRPDINWQALRAAFQQSAAVSALAGGV